ncbi:MAG: hypothetical protein QXW70_00795 [Candidatus Anstonellales archaeon]
MSNKNHYVTGQLISIDAVVSLIALIFIILLFLYHWTEGIKITSNLVRRNGMEQSAIVASDILLKSSGYPHNWNQSNVQAIGLASSPHVLSVDKILAFKNISYNTSKKLLGIVDEFYFYIDDIEGNRIHEVGNSTSSELSISVVRFALLDGKMVRVGMLIHG